MNNQLMHGIKITALWLALLNSMCIYSFRSCSYLENNGSRVIILQYDPSIETPQDVSLQIKTILAMHVHQAYANHSYTLDLTITHETLEWYTYLLSNLHNDIQKLLLISLQDIPPSIGAHRAASTNFQELLHNLYIKTPVQALLNSLYLELWQAQFSKNSPLDLLFRDLREAYNHLIDTCDYTDASCIYTTAHHLYNLSNYDEPHTSIIFCHSCAHFLANTLMKLGYTVKKPIESAQYDDYDKLQSHIAVSTSALLSVYIPPTHVQIGDIHDN